MTPTQIIDVRKKLRLTQGQFANMLGVHAMTVSKWERGVATPTPYNVQQMMLLADGAKDLDAEQRRQFKNYLAMGLAAGALAFVVALALKNRR